MNVRFSRAQALLAAGAFTTTSVLAIVGASSASAHMGIELRGSTPTAGSSSTIMFRPGHGCDGDATNALSVEIPDGVTGVKAQPKAGWKLSTSNNGKPAEKPKHSMRQEAGSRYTRNAANQLKFLTFVVDVVAGLVVSFMPLFSGFLIKTFHAYQTFFYLRLCRLRLRPRNWRIVGT
jgi:hypothetical protein